jgi:hypothetical protein
MASPQDTQVIYKMDFAPFDPIDVLVGQADVA